MPLDVRPIDRETHLAFVAERSASFLQCPSWAGRQGRVGAPLARAGTTARPSSAPGSSCCGGPRGLERYLAYLPEGPVLDWAAYDAADVLGPLRCALKRQKAFAVKMGPQVAGPPLVGGDHQGRDRRRARPSASRRTPGLRRHATRWRSPTP